MAKRSRWKCPECGVVQIGMRGIWQPRCEKCGHSMRLVGLIEARKSLFSSWSERLTESFFHSGCLAEWVGVCLLAGGFGAIAGGYHAIDGVVNIERMFFIGIAFFLGMGFLIKGVLQKYLAKK